MYKKTIITALLTLIAMASEGQIHYRLEGTVGDSTMNTKLLLNQSVESMDVGYAHGQRHHRHRGGR